ncbi:hypothetical protein BT69DRAFT_1342084 [Atractiella rhizophila]|nr:hypothetical protein BT69DRAFT_1342084 [Atractiella rhizophila]
MAYRLLENCHRDAVPMVYGIYTFGKGMGLIVMEFLEPASECQDRKVMTSQRRLELITAIKKIHACGILHGDVEMRMKSGRKTGSDGGRRWVTGHWQGTGEGTISGAIWE